MSTYSCPHNDVATDACTRLGKPCLPCQPGCVLHGKATIAKPVVTPVRRRRSAG